MYVIIQDMDPEQEQVRQFVKRLLELSGLKPTQLARKADLAPTTVTRFLNSKDAKHTISARTLIKLVEASGLTWPILSAEDQNSIWPLWQRMPPSERRVAVEILRGLLRAKGIDYPELSPPISDRGHTVNFRRKGRRRD